MGKSTHFIGQPILGQLLSFLKKGNAISQHNFTQFMITLRSAGFLSKKLVNSVMAIDFAYTVFLILQKSKEVPVAEIKRIVQKWYVLSVLTGRYSSSPESAFATDIRLIRERSVVAVLKDIEAAQLSDNFWNIGLVQNQKSVPYTCHLHNQRIEF